MLKAIISESPLGYPALWIAEVNPATGQICAIAKPVTLEFVELKEADPSPEPTLRFRPTDGLLLSLREALDNIGVRSPSDDKIEGLLEATRYNRDQLAEANGRLMDMLQSLITANLTVTHKG